MESRKSHRAGQSQYKNGISRPSDFGDNELTEERDEEALENKDTTDLRRSSSISTILEEMGNEDVGNSHENQGKVPTAATAKPAGDFTMLEDTGYKNTVHSSRSWNILPRIGETVHNRKHSLNFATLKLNGVNKEIVYDPRYNALFPKVEIFYSANAHTTTTDAYVHAKTRLESYIQFLEIYHNSRRYASACYPFKVNIAPTGASSGYPSYMSGINYEEIGEMIQFWFTQALKFILDKNSMLFSREIASFLNKRSAALLERAAEPALTDDEKDIMTDTLKSADILLIRCALEEEFSWQLALDEPNWNIVDFFVDLTPFSDRTDGKPQQNTDGDKASNVTATSTQSSLSVNSSSAENSSTSSVSEETDEKDSLENVEKVNPGSTNFHIGSELPNLGTSCVQDCMGRDLTKLSDRKPGMAALARKLTENSIEDARSERTTKREKKVKFPRGAASTLGLSNIFKRKASHADSLKNESNGNSFGDSAERVNFNIQNRYLEDYYANILGNYRKLILPAQYVFPKKNLIKLAQKKEKLNEAQARNYEKEFLKIKLPLESNFFPVIMCPDVWIPLPFAKWKGFLKEVYRCISPGGFLQTSTSNFITTNICEVSGKDNVKFSTTRELDDLTESISLEGVKRGLRVYPMRYLVQLLKEVGFVDVNYTVVSLKRGDFTTNMGMIFEFLALYYYDFQLRAGFLDADKAPQGTDPASFPLRYVKEHLGSVDNDAGVLRLVLTTARKPME